MFELVVRVVFSLAVVFGLLMLIAKLSSRRFGGRARSMISVVARQPLARGASLAVVEIGDRVLVVGVSENGIRLLTEMDPAELPLEIPADLSEVDLDAAPSRGASAVPARLQASRLGVLSTDTWRQAWAAATNRNGARSG